MEKEIMKEVVETAGKLDKILEVADAQVNAYKDVAKDYKGSNNRIFYMFIGLLLVMVIGCVGGVYAYMQQQEKYLTVIENQQKDFIAFLNQYDFQTIEATQDGAGTNIVGGGDVTNGAESKDTSEDSKR